MGLFLAMRVDIHEMKLYVVPMPLNMTLEIDGFKVVPIMDEFSLAEAFIHIWGICDDVSSIETLQNNFPSGTGEWLSSECDEPECSSEERGSQADTQIHATGLRDVSPPRGEGVVMANFNTNHTVVPLVASMLCLLDIPAHTFVWDVALVVDNTDPNGNRSNEM
ncbi:predicted protein [Arabidopsis lyrata subsp. lyrata]|uniref:Predicted protein n=1 Tax=Arabidopsis lyrata subsp. lyrata TaxID=81972 RepID=D7LFD8_ARALL|nr:predicted protein [Arabidopsis lyrata subsp. lyrata]